MTIEGQHTLSERQGSLTPLSPSNIEDSPVITRDSLRRISSVPEGDLRDSLDHLNILEYAPSMATASPSLPRTGTMLMREHQDQQMTTLLSSVSAVLKMLKKSSEVSELMMAAQSMSLLCGRGLSIAWPDPRSQVSVVGGFDICGALRVISSCCHFKFFPYCIWQAISPTT